MTGNLILVKHSHPAAREDIPAREWKLSQEGQVRARRLAQKLIPFRPDVIVSSTEPKAKETAEILAREVHLEFHTAENLHEHDRSNVPLLSEREFHASVRRFFERPDELVFGHETANEAYARFQRAVDSILETHVDSVIVIVAHGTVISLFLSQLTGESGMLFWKELGLPSFVVIDLRSQTIIAKETHFEEEAMEYIDLRSDTVTKPTPEMREAMAEAEVGDDVYRDDPTVNRLEEMAAEMLGKEAALFVPSGTMGNLIALLVHCQRGDEVIVGSSSHIYLNEAGGMAALGGIQACPLQNRPDGTLALEDIQASIRTEDVHHPITRLICLENTQNICGGVPLRAEYTRQVGELAGQNGLFLHIDGARIFNAATALSIPVKELVEPADSVMFCLSKGLVAPIGSMLVGTSKFIARGRHIRKMVGGGMRQVGVLAAAGIISLEKMTKRLGDDHARARRLADGLRKIGGLQVDADSPQTNMVYLNLSNDLAGDAWQITGRMKELGVLVDPEHARRFRLVLHYWIDDAAVEKTIAAFRQALN